MCIVYSQWAIIWHQTSSWNAPLCIVYIAKYPLNICICRENQWFSNVVFGQFLAFWVHSLAQIWSKNRSKYKISILNTPELVEVVKLAKTSYYNTKKTVENQKNLQKNGSCLVFWAKNWPKIGPKISPNIKFEFEYPQGVDKSGKPSQYISYMYWNFLLQ